MRSWYHVGSPSMLEGKTFLGATGMPIEKRARVRTRLAVWLPEPFTVAAWKVRSLTIWSGIRRFLLVFEPLTASGYCGTNLHIMARRPEITSWRCPEILCSVLWGVDADWGTTEARSHGRPRRRTKGDEGFVSQTCVRAGTGVFEKRKGAARALARGRAGRRLRPASGRLRRRTGGGGKPPGFPLQFSGEVAGGLVAGLF